VCSSHDRGVATLYRNSHNRFIEMNHSHARLLRERTCQTSNHPVRLKFLSLSIVQMMASGFAIARCEKF
jgi:hypothetical protein